MDIYTGVRDRLWQVYSTYIDPWEQEQEEEEATVPPIPSLPAHRAHNLEETLDHDQHVSHGTINSALFQRLPSDIRRLILLDAFGDRILDMDLRYDYPFDTGRSASYFWGSSSSSTVPRLNRNGPRKWRWYGCVCHRYSESRVIGNDKWKRSVLEPQEGKCLFSYSEKCEDSPGEWPSECFVGVMGWLRTCRQAYVEGIEILYTTNRFHISGMALVQNLGQVLRPKHLAMITSVEMSWNLGLVARPPPDRDLSSDRRFSGWYTFISLLSSLTDDLPNLRYLHLSLLGEWFPPQMAPNDIVRRSETDLLQPLDEMVQKVFFNGDLSHEINVAIPVRIFWTRSLMPDAKASARVEKGNDSCGVSDRVWRPLEKKTEDADHHEGHELGYWITHQGEAF